MAGIGNARRTRTSKRRWQTPPNWAPLPQPPAQQPPAQQAAAQQPATQQPAAQQAVAQQPAAQQAPVGGQVGGAQQPAAPPGNAVVAYVTATALAAAGLWVTPELRRSPMQLLVLLPSAVSLFDNITNKRNPALSLWPAGAAAAGLAANFLIRR